MRSPLFVGIPKPVQIQLRMRIYALNVSSNTHERSMT